MSDSTRAGSAPAAGEWNAVGCVALRIDYKSVMRCEINGSSAGGIV